MKRLGQIALLGLILCALAWIGTEAAMLTWTSSNDDNEVEFWVQRSTNLIDWVSIALLPGRARAYTIYPTNRIQFYRVAVRWVDSPVNWYDVQQDWLAEGYR
jgi:hypothetical protein